MVFLLGKFVFKKESKVLLLIASFAFGIGFGLMLGLAIIALFLRPQIKIFKASFDTVVGCVVSCAYYASVVILGILVSTGLDFKLGIIVGILAFASQIFVTNILLFNFDKNDKIKLSLAQYNGITSIILASFLQQYFNQTVSIVAVSLIVISILYFGANSIVSKNPKLN